VGPVKQAVSVRVRRGTCQIESGQGCGVRVVGLLILSLEFHQERPQRYLELSFRKSRIINMWGFSSWFVLIPPRLSSPSTLNVVGSDSA
jgi:hypothetical protein